MRAGNDLNRDTLRSNFVGTRSTYHELVESLAETDWNKPSSNPNWTIGDLLVRQAIGLGIKRRVIDNALRDKDYPPKWVPVSVSDTVLLIITRLVSRLRRPTTIRNTFDTEHEAILALYDQINDINWNKTLCYWGYTITIKHLFLKILNDFKLDVERIKEGLALQNIAPDSAIRALSVGDKCRYLYIRTNPFLEPSDEYKEAICECARLIELAADEDQSSLENLYHKLTALENDDKYLKRDKVKLLRKMVNLSIPKEERPRVRSRVLLNDLINWLNEEISYHSPATENWKRELPELLKSFAKEANAQKEKLRHNWEKSIQPDYVDKREEIERNGDPDLTVELQKAHSLLAETSNQIKKWYEEEQDPVRKEKYRKDLQESAWLSKRLNADSKHYQDLIDQLTSLRGVNPAATSSIREQFKEVVVFPIDFILYQGINYVQEVFSVANNSLRSIMKIHFLLRLFEWIVSVVELLFDFILLAYLLGTLASSLIKNFFEIQPEFSFIGLFDWRVAVVAFLLFLTKRIWISPRIRRYFEAKRWDIVDATIIRVYRNALELAHLRSSFRSHKAQITEDFDWNKLGAVDANS